MTYPPSSGQEPYGQGDPQQPGYPGQHPGADQGGWQMPPPEPTLPYQQPSQTQPIYPQQQGAQPQAQQPYSGQPYPGADPYAQAQAQAQGQQPGQYPQQGQYPYAGPGQPGYDYSYGAGYGAPPQPPGGSRNAMIAVAITVALLAGGFSVYWFGFHNKSPNPNPTNIALESSLASTPGPGGSSAPPQTSAAAPSPSDTTAQEIAELQALMATMTDKGCKSAFQAIITFEQQSKKDSGNDTAIINDYDTAISSLTSAQGQTQNANAAAAIGQVVSDWKSYTAALAGGQTPDDTAMTTDGQQLAQACLGS